MSLECIKRQCIIFGIDNQCCQSYVLLSCDNGSFVGKRETTKLTTNALFKFECYILLKIELQNELFVVSEIFYSKRVR